MSYGVSSSQQKCKPQSEQSRRDKTGMKEGIRAMFFLPVLPRDMAALNASVTLAKSLTSWISITSQIEESR